MALLISLGTLRAGDVPGRDDFQRWAAELASGQFSVRQNATQRLLDSGPAAVPPLAAAIRNGDAEVRRRAIRVLVEQSLAPRLENRQTARDALAELATSDDPLVAGAARAALATLREVNVNLAAAELTRLSATVMPQSNASPPTFAVQIRQAWTGGDDGLALLPDLGDVTWLSIENAPLTDACLPHIARLTTLQNLYLGSSRLSGSGLAQLATLGRLQYLSLRQLPLTDRRLNELPDLPQLGQLGLDRTLIGNAGLDKVARYPNLDTLWLDYTQVTDAGLARLRPLANLRTLYLAGTQMSGPGLVDLQELPALRSLSLKDAKLGPDALRQLASVHQLESLGLDSTSVTDEQLGELAALSQLRVLWLNQTAIGDDGLRRLKGLSRLQRVYLTGTKVSPEGIAEMKQALPQSQFAR